MLLSFTSKRVMSLLLVGSLDTVFSNFKGTFSKISNCISVHACVHVRVIKCRSTS